MIGKMGEFSNRLWFKKQEEDPLSDKAILKRLRWTAGRAVFRMPEASDEQLSKMRMVHSAEECRDSDIALQGILAELADPDVRRSRAQQAREFSRKSPARVFAKAAKLCIDGEMDPALLRREFMARMNFYALLPDDEKEAPVKLEKNGSGPEIRIYSLPEFLPGESSEDPSRYIEGPGESFLLLQAKLDYPIAVDHGMDHEIMIPRPGASAPK